MNAADVAQLYRNQGIAVPKEFMDSKELKEHKYGASKKLVDGILFDSALEARAYRVLDHWKKLGAISDLRMQLSFTLQEKFKDSEGKTVRRITYSVDFRFFDESQRRLRYVDAKGCMTQGFERTMKLMKDKHPDVRVELWDKVKVRELERA